jgi:hypothetical protein
MEHRAGQVGTLHDLRLEACLQDADLERHHGNLDLPQQQIFKMFSFTAMKAKCWNTLHMANMSSITGRHYYHLLPTPPLPALNGTTTSSYCRSHRWNHSRPLSNDAHTWVQRDYLPDGFNASIEQCCQYRLDPFPVFGGTGS